MVASVQCPETSEKVECSETAESLAGSGRVGSGRIPGDRWALTWAARGAVPQLRGPRVGTDLMREELPGRQVRKQV